MLRKFYANSIILIFLLISFIPIGCNKNINHTFHSDPSQATIYWGKTQLELEKTPHKTPYTRTLPASELEPWCYQIKMDGYHDSEVYCENMELSGLEVLYINPKLIPIKTAITSDPPGSIIYWGPTLDRLNKTKFVTPITISDLELGANWKDWYFQVKKDGFDDSEIVFKSESNEDRKVHFNLISKKKIGKKNNKESATKAPDAKKEITFAWVDTSDNEEGFQIEKKNGINVKH